jgi:hypothetical protein
MRLVLRNTTQISLRKFEKEWEESLIIDYEKGRAYIFYS